MTASPTAPPLRAADLDAPLLEASTGDDGWSCRLFDRLDLLRVNPDYLPREMRFGGAPAVAEAGRRTGDGTEWAVRDWRRDPDRPGVPDGLLLAVILAARLMDFASELKVDEAVRDAGVPGVWVDPVVVRCRDVLRAREPGGDLAAFVRRVVRECEGARAALDPFLRRLDLRAVMLLRSRGFATWPEEPVLPRSPGRGPLAPLATALAWHPRFPDVLTDLACGKGADDLDLPRAVAAGPEAVGALLRANLGLPGSPGSAYADACMRSAASLSALPAEGASRAEHALDELARWERRRSGSRIQDAVREAGRLLAHLPPDWVPRDEASWKAFAVCGPALSLVTRTAAPADVARLVGSGADWHALAARLAAAAGGVQLRQAVLDVGDMAATFARQVLVPALAAPRSDDVAYPDGIALPLLASGRGVRRLLETSRRWHAARRRMTEGLPPASGTHVGWPAAWPSARLGPVTVSEVTDRAALEGEGGDGPDRDGVGGLAHCVGGYAPECLSGRSRILSLRAADGARLSTAQVAWDGVRVRVLQHAGLRNALPPHAADEAMGAYVEAIGAGRLQVDADALAPLEDASGLAERAGFDVDAPGAWEAVRDRWDPFLPRTLRGLSAPAWSALVGREASSDPARRWGAEPVRP